jgi:membrane-associated protein
MSFGFDLVEVIRSIGYLGLFAIVFAESGLFFGFFLPGDSLLLTAGLLASPHATAAMGLPEVLNLWVLLPLLFVAAFLGDQVGYWFGAKTGPRIFTREQSLLFRRKNLLAAKAFYEKHGGKTIVLARFMPFIRTFAPIVAGAAEMQYRRFVAFNMVGAFLWAICVTLIGYFFGELFGSVEGVERYFTLIILAVIGLSVLPTAIHIWRENGPEIVAWLRARLTGAKAEGPVE